MESDHQVHLHFDTYPAPVEKIADYVRAQSLQAEVRGHYLMRIFLKLLVIIARSLSWKVAYWSGKVIGLLFYTLGLRRQVAMTNLDIVYGTQKSPQEKKRIYRESLINLGRVIINYLRLPFMGTTFWRDHCEWKSEPMVREIMNRKRGAICISGHIGMMDLLGGKAGMSGYPASLVGKRIKNPAINRFLIETRKAMNVGTIAHRDSMNRIMEGIGRGEIIGMALDQNMKKDQGVFVNWMGRSAMSVRSPAFIARNTGAPVLAGYMYQKSEDRFEVVITEEVTWEQFPDDPEKELLINTQKQSDAVQRIIYAHPELWFWIHRRWKSQPEGVPNPYQIQSR